MHILANLITKFLKYHRFNHSVCMSELFNQSECLRQAYILFRLYDCDLVKSFIYSFKDVFWGLSKHFPLFSIFTAIHKKPVDSSGIRTRNLRVEGEDAVHLITVTAPGYNCFFKNKNRPTTASFIVYFWSFQANIITILSINIFEKMSIQYMVTGFETMTFGT